MTTAFLNTDLQRDEGFRGTAYPDPRTKGPPWTIGFGHTGREVHPGLMWSMAQALGALADDEEATCVGLDTAIPWWNDDIPDLIQDCLANIAFNVGVHGLLEFGTFLALVNKLEFPEAALDLRGTLWFREVGDRGVRIVKQLATGQHQE